MYLSLAKTDKYRYRVTIRLLKWSRVWKSQFYFYTSDEKNKFLKFHDFAVRKWSCTSNALAKSSGVDAALWLDLHFIGTQGLYFYSVEALLLVVLTTWFYYTRCCKCWHLLLLQIPHSSDEQYVYTPRVWSFRYSSPLAFRYVALQILPFSSYFLIYLFHSFLSCASFISENWSDSLGMAVGMHANPSRVICSSLVHLSPKWAIENNFA